LASKRCAVRLARKPDLDFDASPLDAAADEEDDEDACDGRCGACGRACGFACCDGLGLAAVVALVLLVGAAFCFANFRRSQTVTGADGVATAVFLVVVLLLGLCVVVVVDVVVGVEVDVELAVLGVGDGLTALVLVVVEGADCVGVVVLGTDDVVIGFDSLLVVVVVVGVVVVVVVGVFAVAVTVTVDSAALRRRRVLRVLRRCVVVVLTVTRPELILERCTMDIGQLMSKIK